MLRAFLPLFVLIYCFFVPQGLFAQNAVDSTLILQPIQKVVDLYRKEIGGSSPIFQGHEYVSFDPRIEGHPFFQSDKFTPATFSYDGVLYQQVPVVFDIVREKVVVLHPEGFYNIVLINSKIDYFILQDHTFKWIDPASMGATSLSAGFYDVLYLGKGISVLVKREKEYKEFIKGIDPVRRFEQEVNYYILKDQTLHHVKKKRAALKLFPDNKKETRRHLKKNKINFRRDPEKALVAITKFNEQSHKSCVIFFPA